MRESTLWLLQIATAIAILFLAVIHLANFSTLLGVGYSAGNEFATVFARGKNLFYTSALLIFSAVVLYHGLYGVRNIVLEIVSGEKAEKAVTWLILVIGILAFLYAAYGILLFYLI